MQEVKETVLRCRSTLMRFKQNRANAVGNPVVTDWLRIDNPDQETIAREFGITADLTSPRKQFKETAATIQHQLDVLDNDLGCLTADLPLTVADPKKMLGIAEQIEKRCADLSHRVDLLLSFEKIFEDSEKTLRQNLEFGHLTSAVPALTGGSANFDIGLKVLRCTSGANSVGGKQPALPDFQLRANNLAAKLQKVELPDRLPPAGLAMISEQISRVNEAVRTIGDYIDYVDDRISDLTPAVQKLEQDLQILRKEPASEIFDKILEMAKQCETAVSAFQKYAKILTAAERLEVLIEEIKLFSISIKGEVIKDFARSTLTSDAALHPPVFASGYAQQYFAGIPGLVRILRFLYGAVLGRKMLTQPLLADILESALARFPQSTRDPGKQKSMIEEIGRDLLSDFARPFPFQELQQMTTRMLNDYFSALEADFANRKISFPDEGRDVPLAGDDQQITQNLASGSIGNLISRIERRAENLQEWI